MSRRLRTILYLTVRVPVPLGISQATVLEDVNAALQAGLSVRRPIPTTNYDVNEILVKLARKETSYL